MYNVLLCDDNEVFLSETEKMITAEYKGILNVTVSKTIAEALAEISEMNMDIAVLDIEMDKESGIDLARILNEKFPDCRIIYLTNHISYATDVYSTDHTYFVLKDDMDKNLPRAIEKAVNEKEAQKNDFITVSSKDRKRVLKICDILYCERTGRTTTVFLKEETFVSLENLDKLYDMLSEKGFTKCHKSFIVNMDKVSEIFRNKYVFEGGKEVPISRSFSDSTKTDFAKFMCRGV